MMKKIWISFIAGLFFVILSACQGNEVVSKLGIVEDDIYINDFMGIQFQIPPGWRIASSEEMRDAFDFDDREIFFLYQLELEENYRILFDEGNFFFDMMSHSPETGEMFTSVISRIPEKNNNRGQDEIIQRIISSNMFLGDFMINYALNYTLKEPVQIGDFEWQLLEVSETFWVDFTMYTTVYFRIEGENLFMLFFNGSMTGDFTETLKFLNEVNAPRLEHKSLPEISLSNEYENDILFGKISNVFPDSMVATSIASSLGHEHTEVEVYQSDLLKIETLSLSSISNIEGLQYLTNLIALNLWNSELNNIELLTKLPNLRRLCLEKSIIEDYKSLTYLTQLTRLSLSNTDFRNTSLLANLINLEDLNLNETEVNDISPLKTLINLENLSLNGTEVNDISPLEPLKNLRFFSIHGNGIFDISVVSNFQKLTNLILTYNQIDDLSPLSELNYLVRLCANWNQITDVTPLKNLTNLTWLNLEMNLISDVSPLANLTELSALNLNFNALLEIDALSELAVFERIRIY